MTRMKIDLNLATEEWIANERYASRRFESHKRQIESWSERSKNESLERHILTAYLSKAIGHSIEWATIGKQYVSIRLNGSFTARDLSRLINTEIVRDGNSMVFQSLSSESEAGEPEGFSARAFTVVEYV